MTNRRFAKLFGGPRRKPETKITQREMDIAASIQAVVEECMLKIAGHVKSETNQKNLCLAGGVALNCVANGRILRKGLFEDIWIQPAAGDAGGALGAVLSVWHRYLGNERPDPEGADRQKGSYLGPQYDDAYIMAFLEKNNYPYRILNGDGRAKFIAEQIAGGKIVGYMAGRMEFGPRALGARSILGDPRREETQTVMNLKIKYRESFRPFAPSVLEEKVSDYFDIDKIGVLNFFWKMGHDMFPHLVLQPSDGIQYFSFYFAARKFSFVIGPCVCCFVKILIFISARTKGVLQCIPDYSVIH